jgi:hypothetical protein
VFAPQVIQGRWLGAEDLEALQRLIAEHPHWSRRRLSIALCEALNWRTASGQLKDMSARLLLNKLAERGFVKLPPRRPGGGRQILRALSEPELFSLSAGGGGPIITLATGPSQLGLVGGTSPVVGVIVHLFISGLIGISYGLLFEHESPDIAAGIAWGSFTVWFGGSSAG